MNILTDFVIFIKHSKIFEIIFEMSHFHCNFKNLGDLKGTRCQFLKIHQKIIQHQATRSKK